ncbi:MAG: dTDP-glucose 4,6-dehydratase [Patescibacteria group bacterium]|nr:MAG: dTDP-glucose 4,6-dehydratase [Patescibacteria group bacterium]
MRILVTGGAGFIGSNFIHYWLKKYPDDEVLNLDKLTYAGNLDNLKDIENLPNYTFVKGDICDQKLVEELMKSVDVVVHFAAETHVDRSIHSSADFITTNIIGTITLLNAALKYKIKRFHHISTDEVFGSLSLETEEKFNEKTCYKPNNPYSASKASSDHFVRAFARTYGLPITITNCSNNYGPYQYPEKFIPLMITNLIEDKPIPIYGDGRYARDWLYVTDHCRGIDLVLKDGKEGETYLIGGMYQTITNLQLAELVIKLMGKSKDLITFVKDRPGHDVRYAVDWSKINKELGWKPKVDLQTGLKKTIKWYLDNRQWWQRIKSGEFKNYLKKQYKN